MTKLDADKLETLLLKLVTPLDNRKFRKAEEQLPTNPKKQ